MRCFTAETHLSESAATSRSVRSHWGEKIRGNFSFSMFKVSKDVCHFCPCGTITCCWDRLINHNEVKLTGCYASIRHWLLCASVSTFTTMYVDAVLKIQRVKVWNVKLQFSLGACWPGCLTYTFGTALFIVPECISCSWSAVKHLEGCWKYSCCCFGKVTYHRSQNSCLWTESQLRVWSLTDGSRSFCSL